MHKRGEYNKKAMLKQMCKAIKALENADDEMDKLGMMIDIESTDINALRDMRLCLCGVDDNFDEVKKMASHLDRLESMVFTQMIKVDDN